MGTQVALFILVLSALALQPGVEGVSCRRPMPQLHGRYEYQYSPLLSEEAEYLPEGFVVRVLCNPGAELQGEEFIQCEDNGRWSGNPICRARTCMPPQRIKNGFRRVRISRRGRWAVYGCNPGFYLLGGNVLTCGYNGIWNSSAPLCVPPPSCQAPEIAGGHNLTATLKADTGHVIGGLYTEQSVCAVECPLGFVPSRDYNLTCRGGEWVASGEIPECLVVTCDPPSLEPISHGRSNVANRSYFVGEAVNYRCDYGYRLEGKSWQVCNHRTNQDTDGVWSVEKPSCVVVRCPNPTTLHLKNGQVFFTPTSMTIGTVMTLRCESMYKLLGSSERVCQPDGTWNGTLASCHRKDYECKALGNPIQGSIYAKHGDLEIDPQFRIGETVYFRCNDGHEMVGSKQRFCTRNEEWTGEMPRCLERHEYDPTQIVSQGLGETFDQIAIEGGSHAWSNGTNSAESRRRRSINLAVKSIDIWFAFDASSSVGDKYFNLSKHFAKALVTKISPAGPLGKTRIGAVWFSTSSGVGFKLIGNTTEYVLTRIERIGYRGLGTNIGSGLRLVKSLVEQDINNGNQAVSFQNRRVLFLLTDGMNNMGGVPVSIANELKERYDVDIHCIGLGSEVNVQKLASISSVPHNKYMFSLEDYQKLDDIVHEITSSERDYSQCGKAGTNIVEAGTNEASPGEHPWMAAIYRTDSFGNRQFICGGSLIDKNWILTAAHCLLTKDITELSVFLGLTDRLSDEEKLTTQRFEVAEAIRHHSFNESGFYQYDIGLIKLDGDAVFTPVVRTVCLPSRQENAVTELQARTATVTGWGKKVRGDERFKMKEVMMKIVDRNDCGNALLNATTSLCAGLPDRPVGQGVCEGDSGGPLVVWHEGPSPSVVQMAVVSYSDRAANGQRCATSYDIYTRVPPFLDWIDNIRSEH